MKLSPAALVTVLLTVFVVATPAPSRAEVATDVSIRELLKISGLEESMRASMAEILPALVAMPKNTPDAQVRALMDPDRMATALIATHRKYFSEEEVRDLIAFYKTPVGRKRAKLDLQIQKESADLHIRSWRASLIDEAVQKGNFTVEPTQKSR